MTVSGTIKITTAGTRVQASHKGNVKTVVFKARSDNTGDEYMTLAITPNATTNKLIIEVTIHFSASVANMRATVALFQDSTASALAVAMEMDADADTIHTVSFSHVMDAGTTSSTTFKVRMGNNDAGTTTFNGAVGARKYGGVLASGIRIWEVTP